MKNMQTIHLRNPAMRTALPRLGFVRLMRQNPQARHANASEFYLGDKVICINARGLTRGKYSPPPVKGQVCCARESFADINGPGICVVGISAPPNGAWLEWGFVGSRFRLVHQC